MSSAPVAFRQSEDNSPVHNEHASHGTNHNGMDNEGLDPLDDHRFQSSSLPRAGSITRPRRGTLGSIRNNEAATAANTVNAANTASASTNIPLSPRGDPNLGPLAIDFEFAITDDERSLNGDNPISPHSRKNTFSRRNRNKSRASSRSSSTSAPNSIHAFAERTRRRHRTGTINSRPASVNSIRRTISGGTHRRRPTFSENDGINGQEKNSDPENDVCYPQSDEDDEESIDFSELEDFVAEAEDERPTLEAVPIIVTKPPTPERKPQGKPMLGSDDDIADLEKQAHPEQRPQSVSSRRGSQAIVDLGPHWWTFFSSDFDDAIHSTSLGGLLEPGETFQNLFRLPEDEGCWWLDGLNPSEEEVVALCKAFGVHPLTREDIVTREAREKVELFKKYYFVSFRSFNADKDSEDFLEPVNVYAVVFRQGLLTFSFTPKNPHPRNVLKRMGKLQDYMSISADWICYAMIDDIVDAFNPWVQAIESEVDAIEDSCFISREEDARGVLRSIGQCRKKVMSLLRLLGSKSDVIKGFAKRCNEGFDSAPRGDVGLYLSDIQDHVITMREHLAHSEQLLSRIHNNYLAQVNVDHISSGNHVNKVLSKITLLASILVPLNLVTGLFGMNVPVPGGVNPGGLGWFFGIVGFLFTFVLISVVVARRLRFI